MRRRDLKLLYRSFDDQLSEEEQKHLETGLSKSRSLRAEKERLIAMRQTIHEDSAMAFQPFFPDRVIRKIRAAETLTGTSGSFADALMASFRPLAAAALVLTILLVTYNLIRSDRISLAAVFAEPEITVEEVHDPLFALSLE